MTMHLDLLPCPFCGSTSVHLAYAVADYVVCQDCSAYGPTEETRDGRLWNTRTFPRRQEASSVHFACEKQGTYAAPPMKTAKVRIPKTHAKALPVHKGKKS